MIALKIYLFLGLVVHKLVWESLKQKDAENPSGPVSFGLTAIKAVKVGILLGVLIQIWMPEIFPISSDPFALQVAGTSIYTIGLATALLARIQLGDNWANIETGRVLENQVVVASGIYTYVRHPIYIGDLLLLVGLELALNSWLVIGVLALAPLVMFKAVKEEQMLADELPGYEAYRRRSKRFIPFVF